jgi:hypothetical protein
VSNHRLPFPRHEKPVDNALSHQNMQDRYHGRNDPVARKIMAAHADAQGLAPPEDQSIVGIQQGIKYPYPECHCFRCPCSYRHFPQPPQSRASAHESFSRYLLCSLRSSNLLFTSPRQGSPPVLFSLSSRCSQDAHRCCRVLQMRIRQLQRSPLS